MGRPSVRAILNYRLLDKLIVVDALKLVICLLTVGDLRKKRLFVLDSPSLSDLGRNDAMTRYLPLQEKGTKGQGQKGGRSPRVYTPGPEITTSSTPL